MANDSVGSIRTIASFCAEEKVMEIYKEKCEGPIKKGIRRGIISGFGFGLSFFMLYAVYACCFYAGARLVEDGKSTFSDVFVVCYSPNLFTITYILSPSQLFAELLISIDHFHYFIGKGGVSIHNGNNNTYKLAYLP